MDLRLPELGEDIEEATVLKILVSEGDEVEMDQSVLEVETDKATLEVPAESAGTIDSIEVSEGDSVKVGQVIAKVSGKGDESEEEEDRETKEAEEEKSEEAQEEEEDSATKEEEAESAGEEGRKELEDEEKDKDKDKDAGKEDEVEAAPRGSKIPVFASPSVRRFAREIGIDIGNVEGTGSGGRISVEDVKKTARATLGGRSGGGPRHTSKPLPDLSQWGETETEEMSKIRRVTADHMSRSWSEAPHVTLFEKADITDFEEARNRFGEEIEKQNGARLTLTTMLVKVVATTLESHPRITAALDSANNRIVRRLYSHIGVAVDTGSGLVVPVIRNVNEKSLPVLADEWEKISTRARENKLGSEEMRGGVFTLTNLGMMGTEFFTPIVNLPEGAILGIGRAAKEPVYDEESASFVPRLKLPLSLSFDHRFIDGAEGARFLHSLAEALEDPLRLALEMTGERDGGN